MAYDWAMDSIVFESRKEIGGQEKAIAKSSREVRSTKGKKIPKTMSFLSLLALTDRQIRGFEKTPRKFNIGSRLFEKGSSNPHHGFIRSVLPTLSLDIH